MTLPENEIVSKRTFSSRTYHLEDGTYRTDCYSRPIFYKNNDNQFIDIPKDNEELLTIAMNQGSSFIGAGGSYERQVRTTGDTFIRGFNEYVGYHETETNLDEEEYSDVGVGAENTGAGNLQYDDGEPYTDANGNGRWDAEITQVIYRAFHSFNENDFPVVSSSGSVELLHTSLFLDPDRVYRPNGVGNFGDVSVRYGEHPITETPSSTSWDQLASGDMIGFSSVINYPDDYAFTITKYEGSFFESVESMIVGTNVSQNITVSIVKDSESFSTDEDYFMWFDDSQDETYLSIVYDIDQVILTNITEESQNLGGYLSLGYQGDWTTVSSINNEELEVFKDDTYSAYTHHFRIDANYHNSWNDGSQKIKWNNFDMDQEYLDSGIKATFKTRKIVDLAECLNESISFYDPWFIEDTTLAPVDWIQPDEFRPLSEMTATGDYEVFLNQNDAFHPEIPIYSLKAPQVYADQNGIYECTGWSGEGIKFDASGATSTTNIETDVVFLTSGAQVWPTYTQVNTSPGYTLILGLDEVLTIPPGAEIECASGFIIDAYFGDIDIQGEPNNPVRLYSQTTWGGIDSWVGGTLDQSIVLENVIIENAVHPIYNSSVYLENQHATIKNCKFINSGGIRAVSTQTMDIRNNIFQNINPNSDNQGILIVSISNDNDPYDIDIVNNTFINFKRSVEVTPTNIGNYYNMENNIFYYSDALNNVNSIAFVHSFQRSGTENVNYNLVYGFDEDGFDFTIYKIIDLVYGSPNFLDEASNNFHLTSGSNAIDKGDPALPFDSDDTRKDIGAYYYPQLSGVLSEDIVIEGEASIGGDFTLSAGHTMTVMPGTEILVAEDVDITIQGTLNAMGTASEPIAFMPNQPTSDKRYWGGISVNSGEVNIKHAEIQNAYNSLYLTSASATMSDLNLHHNYYGIRIVNSSISSIKNSSFSDNYMYALYVSGVSPQLDIASNSFTNNRYGLYLRDYSGKISGNSITGTYYDGIRFAGQSSANMTVARIPGQTPYAVNNHIANTSYGSGITVYYGAFPTLGAYNDFGNKVYGGFNHFYANTGKNSAVNFNTGSLDARLNWWTPGSYNQSKFDWNPSVEDYVPGGGGGSKVGKVSDLSLALDYIYEGDYLFVDSSYVEAIEYYGLAINEEPDDSLAVRALIGMTGCYNALGDNDGMILHLNDIVNTYSGLLVSVSAHDYLVNMQVRGHEYLEALETNLDVIEEYSDMDEVDEAIADSWFDRMVIYQLLALENDGLGKSVPAAEQRSLARKTADFVLSEYTYSTAANLIRVLNGEDEIEVEKTVKPITFALHNVYPNPFNPSVTIPYDLASTSDFSIVIYDVLGREVWSHKQIGQMAGNYSLVWNGMNQAGQLASSGLYLIRFTSPEYTGTQKALLLR